MENTDPSWLSRDLHNYQGWLQTDGYGVYDKIGAKKGIELVRCHYHARRKFYQAKEYDGKRPEPRRAGQVMLWRYIVYYMTLKNIVVKCLVKSVKNIPMNTPGQFSKSLRNGCSSKS